MKFYNGVLNEVNNAASRVSMLAISRIEVGERLYPVDEENVARPVRKGLLNRPDTS